MDYDDSDFQSHNLHIAGEGSNKFPPVLQPYALPKFDFDDSLNGSLRFDSLVETEVFLGIESNEDNQWIEDFSRGTSGIQFSSSAAESCSLSRRNNVWSEATSSESVEMLLKSVGQEDNTPAQTNTKESDACDELGCILKHMEPSLKQDNNTPPKVEHTAHAKFLPGENVEHFSALDNDVGRQQPLHDSSQDHKGEASADSRLGALVDPSAISVEARQPIIEGSLSIDGKSSHVDQREVNNVVNGSLSDSPQKGPASGMQDGASVQNITAGNNEFNDKDDPDNINDTSDGSKDVLETDIGENQEKGHVSSQEGRMEDENPCSAAVESMVEANIIETNLSNLGEPSRMISKGHSGFPEDLVTSDQAKVHTFGGSVMPVEDNTTFARHEMEDSNGSQLDNKNLSSKCEGSHLSAEDSEPSKVKVGGISNSDTGVVSGLTAVCSSAEVVGETNAEVHVSSSVLGESSQICGKTMVPAEGKDTIELPSGNVSTNNLMGSRLQSDAASDNKSASEISCKPAIMVTCDTMDGVPALSSDVITVDAAFGHEDVKMSPLSGMGFSALDKEKEIADKISVEASLSGLKTSSQVIAGLDPVSESTKGASSGAAGQILCESAEQSPLMVDASKTEGPQLEVIDKDSLKCTKEMEVCPVLCDLTANKGDDAEALGKENDENESSKGSEPTINKNEMLGPISLEKEECQEYASQKGQKENEAVIVSGDKSNGKIAVPSTHDCGSGADVGKPASGSPTVIRAAGDFQSESDEGAKCSADQTTVADINASKAFSGSRDPKQSDASKDERSFTFEVSPLANMPQKEAGNKWQPFFNIPVTKVSPIVNASPSASGLVQNDPKIAQDLSHGSLKVSELATVRSGSKGASERKARRSSSKAMGKESARKGNSTKETASVRLEKGEKTSNVSPNPSGMSQHVQSNEMQRYGHVDSSTMKPFVLASSASSLPDLNSSASPSVMFQQPFTDLQQVQLRAQIFVYGALIQGTAPDEAYMISAFGGSDGGKSIWENALRLSIERLTGQKSHLATPETPLQSRPGARAPDQAIKQSTVQSKVISSPIGRTSKGSPTLVNPMVPLSSPLWSVPTPTGDTFQSSSMPRGPFMDHQRALSPLHPHQTPQIRNFAGNPWLSQAPFCGPWVTSPQTPVLDASGRFSAQLITEPVQLTPVKDLSMPIISGPKHVSPGPVQSGPSASVFTGTFPVPDAKKVTASSSQPPTDPKPRKRKKSTVSESPGQNILHPHPQTESVSASVLSSHPSTSVAITTPTVFVSKAPSENFVTSVSTTLIDIRKGNQNAEQRNILSEETLDKVKAARVQAEDATTLAADAVSHSLEIWNQLDKQRNSGLLPDVEAKLASAAVAIAAAAAVAKAAAAAANVASNAALQAKLMADEAVNSGGYSNLSQDNSISASEGMKNLGKATPASILKGDDGTNSSSSILVAAREAARRRVEAASAAAIRAENMDAIVKAAELAAEAVSQAGKIVAMSDPLPLNELVTAGPEGYWKLAQINNELGSKSNDIGRKILNVDRVGGGPDTSSVLGKKATQVNNHGKSPAPTEGSTEDHVRLVDGFLSSGAATAKDAKGQKGYKVSEFENGSRSLGTIEEYNSIKEGSHVEVFKDGNGIKAAWYLANVVDLKDGNAYVSYTDLSSVEGSEKLKEWVALKGEGERAPKIRIARPITAMPFEGTRKRRRAATVDHIWSVGDRVDAWIQDSWWEGVVIEKGKKDDSMLTVHFPVQGETSVVRAWHLRPSLLWENAEWIEWSSSKADTHSTNGGDTPQEKRPRVRSPAVDTKGKDKLSKGFDSVELDKPDEPTLLDLAAHEKLFNIGKSSKDGNKPDALRMTRTGLQKEGSKVIFGVPKPGKKRKFMEVSKHYVADRSSKNNEANDSVKFAKYLMPQGSGSRGWKNTLRTESIEKRTAASKPKVLKSGKQQSVSGRTNTQKDNSLTAAVSVSDDCAVTDHVGKTKASVSHVENTSEKHNSTDFEPLSSSVGAAEGPIFPSFPLPSVTLSSKKTSTSNAKLQRVSKGKLAPAGGKLGRIEEDKVFNGNSSKSTSDITEPRRSNRRIQPTSRLLEGLQSSLMVSKIPSVSHDKSQKIRTASRGNNHG